MSRTRNYSQDTLNVMERFYAALEACKRLKVINSVSEYCEKNNIESAALYRQRKHRERGLFEIGWAVPLIRDCGVSARWLMTGVGSMFAQ